MVVILIVQGPDSGVINAVSQNFDSSKISGTSSNRGERLSSTTNTTSVSFFSSSSSSLQVDPENVLATTKEGKFDVIFLFFFFLLRNVLISSSPFSLKSR